MINITELIVYTLIGFIFAYFVVYRMWKPSNKVGHFVFNFKKGRHRVRPFIYPIFFGNRDILCDFKIDQSLWVGLNEDIWASEQKNKIYGKSFCILPRVRIREGKIKFFLPHHWESLRVVFSSGKYKTFNIYYYQYHKGELTTARIGNVNSDKFKTIIERYLPIQKKPLLAGYHLGPYIGGKKPALKGGKVMLKVFKK